MPLSDLKILDFSILLPGPYATRMLSDMGASVLRVVAPGRSDLVLESPPFLKSGNINANGAWLNRDKDIIELDLKDPASVKKVKELIACEGFDIILEQFRPGVMAKFGLSYEELALEFPELIYCSLTGYGQTGPYRDRAGHDINYLALSGLISHSCRRGEAPSLYGMQIADLAGGALHSIIGILAAVHQREKTGKGEYIDIAMLDGMIPLNSLDGAGFLVSGREPGKENGLLDGGSAYDFYMTKDGGCMSVGSLEPKFWERLCMVIGKEAWIEAGVAAPDIQEKKKELREIFLSKTRSEWEELFAGADACVEPVKTLKEALLYDPQIKARELVIKADIDGEKVLQFGKAIRFGK